MDEEVIARLAEMTADRIDDDPEPEDVQCFEQLQKLAESSGYTNLASTLSVAFTRLKASAEAAWLDSQSEYDSRFN